MEQLLSQKMCQELVKIDTISFDGTFYACPKQFMQLWTIFGIFLQHTLLAIYCLLTSKIEKLFKVVIIKIQILLPQISPKFAMSDWEGCSWCITGCFNNIYLSGCMFHYNQRIIDYIKTHLIGRTYKNHEEFRRFIRAILALLLLPAEEIEPTFNQLMLLHLHVSSS